MGFVFLFNFIGGSVEEDRYYALFPAVYHGGFESFSDVRRSLGV